ncbi:class F sortase [Rhodococcus sp. WS3]|nr:class F sortase [Nocardia globerula]ROZ46674.1 class F sortase [Rhodococcus sp. WS3]
MLCVSGCSDDSDQPVRVLATGQEDLPPALEAAVDNPATPTQLRIGSEAAVVLAIKTTSGGSLIPPEDVSKVGWWADSAFPGSGTGTVVITGHINDVYAGDGFGKKFSSLTPGSVVTLTGEDGHEWTYRIDAVDEYRKDGELPVERLNRMDGPETLALITCGGEFVGPPLGYEDNDIAWATRIPDLS